MSFNANDKDGGGNFTPIEALEPKSYPARLVQLVLMGLQPSRPYNGQPKPPKERMYVAFELSHEFMKDENGNDDPTKPRWVGEDFAFLNLTADRATSTLRYNALDPAGQFGGEWLQLGGAPCQVTLTKEPRKDGKGDTNYVGHVSPAAEFPGYTQPPLVNDVRIFDLDAPDLTIFNSLPKWLQDRIKTNLNYAGSPLAVLLGEGNAAPAEPAPAPVGNATVAPAAPAPAPAPVAPVAPVPAVVAEPVAPAVTEAPAIPAAPVVPTPPPAPPAPPAAAVEAAPAAVAPPAPDAPA